MISTKNQKKRNRWGPHRDRSSKSNNKRTKSPLEESTENVAKIIIPSLSTRWNLEERENETYMLRHFYVTLISFTQPACRLCFFFFANSSRVTVASPPSCPPSAGWTGPAASYYIIITWEPCHSTPNMVKSPQERIGLPSMPWRHCIESRGNLRKWESENTKLVARLTSKCHPGTSFPSAGLASKSDRDKSYCKLRRFSNRKKKTSHKINTFVSASTNRRSPCCRRIFNHILYRRQDVTDQVSWRNSECSVN